MDKCFNCKRSDRASLDLIFGLTVGKVGWVIKLEELEWDYTQLNLNDVLLKEITLSQSEEYNLLLTFCLQLCEHPLYKQHSPSGQAGAYI